ncbi:MULTISPECIES: enoyl-CoA hydratase/isomerase family protein [Streptomyces]|uniref:enoyl-CoA hydratase/isomerase family protein n=1 Tax=Streptomyces TaxID=1883 RepID=UPI00039C091E|nr:MULTISPECIES: enoyl-CoA hydratase-related protein [Streptomyces]MBZ6108572.1 enoyl-CoA hydratase/isomerase family protein [Streptomyces olivaceus]MBZ6122456.1 enoyl-CoA hydratase/isomerase family protein [Streptomyces olivaceus]MBZ6143277.1 enoyl-CoA hydratase/isomerase family protein [Streptomyces olivaceus]MBZ6157117.1 enoyl-CoA hydratase/isomerase family protein [Streptomyces olivaceus]MBZ6184913.1 enoyl-CoA hydratase/isomerase family protein [Streptomyces olivaceus]
MSEERFGEFVLVRRHGDGHVAELALDRSKAMNAVSTAMARSIGAACAALGEDPTVRAVVLTSTHERAFCVGADLKERNSFTDADLLRQRPVSRGAYTSVLELPVPTIAAVHGFALGGGFELALSCDVIVADPTAVVGLPEVSVGVIPGGGGTQLLPRRVGAARAAELVFTARRVAAPEARELGLVDQLVDEGRDREEALDLASRMAANSPVGLRAAKRALRLGHGLDLRTGLEVEDAAWRTVAFSGDRAEGVAAFNEKRAPRWPGE